MGCNHFFCAHTISPKFQYHKAIVSQGVLARHKSIYRLAAPMSHLKSSMHLQWHFSRTCSRCVGEQLLLYARYQFCSQPRKQQPPPDLLLLSLLFMAQSIGGLEPSRPQQAGGPPGATAASQPEEDQQTTACSSSCLSESKSTLLILCDILRGLAYCFVLFIWVTKTLAVRVRYIWARACSHFSKPNNYYLVASPTIITGHHKENVSYM